MLRGLITGILHDTPLSRTSAGGNTFTTGKLKDDSEWYSIVAFGELADTLSKLTKGDSLSVSGKMTLKLYTGKDGNTRIDASVVADQIATVKRKKKPAPPKADQQHDRQDDRYQDHHGQTEDQQYSEDEPF